MPGVRRHPLVAWYPKHSDRSVASTRLRVLAPVEALRAQSWRADLYDPDSTALPDVLVLGKRYGAKDIELAERLQAQGVRIVFDICDNMFFNPFGLDAVARERRKLVKILRIADRVTCSTPALAEIVAREAALAELPLVVDDPYEPAALPDPPVPNGPVPRLLWFGRDGAQNVPNGIADLAEIAELLRGWFQRQPFELLVCSDAETVYERVVVPLGLPSRFIEWTLDGFGAVLASATAVLLPFQLNAFVVPKTHNRLTLCLGAGVPAVATTIPAYREFGAFCYLDDWEAGLEAVLTRTEDARAKAAPARSWIEQRYSMDAVVRQWQAALTF